MPRPQGVLPPAIRPFSPFELFRSFSLSPPHISSETSRDAGAAGPARRAKGVVVWTRLLADGRPICARASPPGGPAPDSGDMAEISAPGPPTPGGPPGGVGVPPPPGGARPTGGGGADAGFESVPPPIVGTGAPGCTGGLCPGGGGRRGRRFRVRAAPPERTGLAIRRSHKARTVTGAARTPVSSPRRPPEPQHGAPAQGGPGGQTGQSHKGMLRDGGGRSPQPRAAGETQP